VRVNDIPIHRLETDNILTYAIPIHEFLINGENKLKLIGTPEDPLEPGKFYAKARVARFYERNIISFEEGEGYAEVAWHAELLGAPVAQLFEFETPNRWVWESAPVIELTPEVRGVLDAFVAEMRGAYAAQDPTPINARKAVFYSETQAAYPPPMEADSAADFAASLSRERPGWTAIPFEPSPGNYRLVADGRLVDCVDADALPLVRNLKDRSLSGKNMPFAPMPMMVAIKQGEVLIVR